MKYLSKFIVQEISLACPFKIFFFQEGQDSPAMRLTGLLLLCLASAFMQLANSKFYLIETAETKSKIVLLLLIYISKRGWTGEQCKISYTFTFILSSWLRLIYFMIYLYKNLYKYHTVSPAVCANVKFNDSLPSHLLISSQDQNFVTPAANFCDYLPSYF